MRIFELLKEDHVIFDLKSGDKEHVLKEFVSALKERGLVSKEKAILDELLKRESLGSTGIENGIAIPHALTKETMNEPLLALALLKKGVNFESPDKMPTRLILLLLGNKDKPGLQLRLLAHICRMVKETKFVEKVKKAKNGHEACLILKEEEEKI